MSDKPRVNILSNFLADFYIRSYFFWACVHWAGLLATVKLPILLWWNFHSLHLPRKPEALFFTRWMFGSQALLTYFTMRTVALSECPVIKEDVRRLQLPGTGSGFPCTVHSPLKTLASLTSYSLSLELFLLLAVYPNFCGTLPLILPHIYAFLLTQMEKNPSTWYWLFSIKCQHFPMY